MPIDPRVQRHRASLVALQALLQDVCLKPQEFLEDAELYSALKSQGSLAAFERTSASIIAGSLNTFKRNAEALPGGFADFDKLRLKSRAALDAQKTRARRAYGTRAALEEKTSDLQSEIEILRQDLMISTQVISLSIKQGRSYANAAGPDVVARCGREQRELLVFLSARTRPADLGEQQ